MYFVKDTGCSVKMIRQMYRVGKSSYGTRQQWLSKALLERCGETRPL